MTGPAWLVLPTFNEAENLDTVVAAARRVLGARPRPRASACWSSTTTRPTAPAPWPTSWPRRTPARSRCCTAPVREGLGPGVPGGLRARARGRRRLRLRDGRRPLPRPGGPRAPARAPCATTAPTSRWARATCPAAASPTGAPSGASSAAAGPGTRGAPCGLQVRDLTGGFKCFRADVLRAIDLPSVRSRGYAFQVELTYRTLVRGLRVVEVPIVFRDRAAGDVEDVLADHRRGGVARAAAAPGRRAPPTSGRGPSSGRRLRAESTQGERQRARPRPGHG